MERGCAYLSHQDGFTVFQHDTQKLRFRAPLGLERYLKVQEWDHGYLVVLTRYRQAPEPVEEYIDLEPILRDLYQDPEGFLAPIREVEVQEDGSAEDR